MQAGTVLFFPLLDGKNLAAEVRELDEFLLDFLQAFLPLAVSDLGLGLVPAAKPIVLVQLLNLGYLRSETPYLFPKNIDVIHTALG